MSITVQDLFDELNRRIGDSSEDRITNEDRYDALTYGTTLFQEKTLNDHTAKSYDLDYFDGVNYYKVSTVLNDLLEANDLNTKVLSNGGQPFTRKSSQEIRAEIGYNFSEDAYSIERRNGDTYLVINHTSKYPKLIMDKCDSLTDNGEWLADTTNSDATSLSIDTNTYSEGNASFKFNIDVSQSANNKATLYNETMIPEDLSPEKDNSSWLIDFNFPSITYISSVTYKWGSSSSNYYSVTKTTDINGNPFIEADFFTIKFDWLGATVTGTPNDENITFAQIDINYSSSQADATSFYVDNIRLVKPEKLRFFYTSYSVGTDSTGNDILRFTSLTDVPYISGQYDNNKFYIVDFAASKIFRDLRLYSEADRLENDGERGVIRVNKIIPKSMTRELKSFKVRGVSFRKRGGNNRKFTI